MCPIASLEGEQVALVCPTGFRKHPKYGNLFYQCTSSGSTDYKILVMNCPNDTVYDEKKVQCLPNTGARSTMQLAEESLLRSIEDNSLPMVNIIYTKLYLTYRC